MRHTLYALAAVLAALLFADASHAGNGVRFVGHGFHGGFAFNASGCGYNGASFAFVPSYTYAVPVQVAVPVPVPVPAPEPTPVPPLALAVPAAPTYAAPALVVPSYNFNSFATYGGFGFNVDTYGGYGHDSRFRNGFRGVRRAARTDGGSVNQQRGLINLNVGGGGGGNVNQQRGPLNLKVGGGGGGGNVNQQRGLVNLKLF